MELRPILPSPNPLPEGEGSAQLNIMTSLHMLKLVEERSGIGELIQNNAVLRNVRYTIRRYQGFVEHSGLPIPGLSRLEGRIDFDPDRDPADWIGVSLGLRLEDGRLLGISIAGPDGTLFSEGHGPSRCLCC